MRRVLFIFMGLLATFFISWSVKAGMPVSRPSDYEDDGSVPWYLQNSTAPVASDEWYLDPEIPLNYIPVPGEDELYMVVDDSGNITGYRHRTQLADGSWVWEDVNPDIPDDYEAVPGLENVYRVTYADGSAEYFLYVRNDDDTYCFVPCDENGVPLDDGADASEITDDYVHVVDNTYALYNDDGVLMGYRERVQDSSGNYVWKAVDTPEMSLTVGNGLGSQSVSSASASDGAGGASSGGSVVLGNEGTVSGSRSQNSDGTYTITDTSTYTSEEDGYTVTYQEVVYMTYDSDGNLISSRKEGPYEVSRSQSSSSATPDQSLIATTLDAELARVSAQVTYNTSKANEVLASLNAERASQGIGQLTMNTGSTAYKIACIRAADMAIYDYSSSESPMYGTLSDMLSRFGVAASAPSENVWRANEKTAAEIHTRFQANEGSRNVRMNSGYGEVGIAIVDMNGMTYIAEVYLGN